mmetsp:Transcript_96532/g.306240  ORF Transcript_96532/g.306240 Transcript_96532/m.306240 type:complete len:488 (-) Transcript_96532:127-1590(-)
MTALGDHDHVISLGIPFPRCARVGRVIEAVIEWHECRVSVHLEDAREDAQARLQEEPDVEIRPQYPGVNVGNQSVMHCHDVPCHRCQVLLLSGRGQQLIHGDRLLDGAPIRVRVPIFGQYVACKQIPDRLNEVTAGPFGLHLDGIFILFLHARPCLLQQAREAGGLSGLRCAAPQVSLELHYRGVELRHTLLVSLRRQVERGGYPRQLLSLLHWGSHDHTEGVQRRRGTASQFWAALRAGCICCRRQSLEDLMRVSVDSAERHIAAWPHGHCAVEAALGLPNDAQIPPAILARKGQLIPGNSVLRDHDHQRVLVGLADGQSQTCLPRLGVGRHLDKDLVPHDVWSATPAAGAAPLLALLQLAMPLAVLVLCEPQPVPRPGALRDCKCQRLPADIHLQLPLLGFRHPHLELPPPPPGRCGAAARICGRCARVGLGLRAQDAATPGAAVLRREDEAVTGACLLGHEQLQALAVFDVDLHLGQAWRDAVR